MYPWQASQREFLNRQLAAGKFPHALLFKGPEGTGKAAFAIEYAMKLLCEKVDAEEACGQCRSCQVFAADTHPDFHYVAPAEKGKTIAVDDIRQLTEKLSKTSQFGRFSLAIIENAEQMNRNSANALLKTLEEPTPDTVLILVTSWPHRLLPTIRSRCVQLGFPVPPEDQALSYLQTEGVNNSELNLSLAHGSPLIASELASEEISEQRKQLLKQLIKTAGGQGVSMALKIIEKIPLAQTLDWSIDFCDDLIRVALSGNTADITNRDLQDVLSKMSVHSNISQLYSYRDLLIERKKQSNIALNTQLLIEDLLIQWKKAFTQAA